MSQLKASAKAAFARQLRAWRAKKGWSQVELGDKIGYSDALISGIENGHKTPTADFAARCDDVFGAPATFTEFQELITREAWPSFYAPALEFELRAVRIHQWSARRPGPVPDRGLRARRDLRRRAVPQP
jgi:transcriptional regulator with XRE-family HTH domain